MSQSFGNSHLATRRAFLTGLASTALAGALVPRLSAEGEIEPRHLESAESLMGLELTDAERQLAMAGIREFREHYRQLRQVELPNSVPPALVFDPRIGSHTAEVSIGSRATPSSKVSQRPTADGASRPADDELAYASLPRLAELLRRRTLSSVELTRFALERLERFGPVLHCVVSSMAERALDEAERADTTLRLGQGGPLTGIPWGAKDLLAARGAPTTWGSRPFSDQMIDEDATVVDRLARAGAVLGAKLSLGELAWGDVWFGGTTRNPWNLAQGSSGSSAGSASATAAGLLPFALGSETWGSIVSPSTRCGTTGLRPSFGRVSRYGAMALSWSMDKLGPIARSVEDCALVFEAIHGPDPRDTSTIAAPYAPWSSIDPRRLRLGYIPAAFEEEREDSEWAEFDQRSLGTLRALGYDPRPVELPDLPINALSFILSAEAAAAFDELTRENRDDELVRQVELAWPNLFRQARFIPAVEYIQANRVRTLAIQQMERLFETVDVYVCPSFGADNLLLTNLTGHPCVVLPNGYRSTDGTPTSITFVGRLFGDAEVLAMAHAYQQATDYHRRRPPAIPTDVEPPPVVPMG